MKLLAIGRPREGADVHEIGRHAREEMAAVWQLNRDAAVREMYSPGRPGAVLVLEATGPQDAEAAVAGLPLAATGLIVFEFVELHRFSAFEVLFADQARS